MSDLSNEGLACDEVCNHPRICHISFVKLLHRFVCIYSCFSSIKILISLGFFLSVSLPKFEEKVP